LDALSRTFKSRRMRWSELAESMGKNEKCVCILILNREETRPFGTPRRRWEDNIKMNLKEIMRNDVD
jgi:hypothetical protein